MGASAAGDRNKLVNSPGSDDCGGGTADGVGLAGGWAGIAAVGVSADGGWNNRVNWTIIIVLFILSSMLAVQVIVPNLFPGS